MAYLPLTQNNLEKWTTMLYYLVESHKFAYAKDILKSNIFYSAANSLKAFNQLP